MQKQGSDHQCSSVHAYIYIYDFVWCCNPLYVFIRISQNVMQCHERSFHSIFFVPSSLKSCRLKTSASPDIALAYWKLVQGSWTPRTPLDYLKGHLPMLWTCQSLQHIGAFCTKARTIFSHSPQANCKTATSAPFSTPPSCHPAVEINQRVSGPQTTPGLIECPPHHAMELLIIATYCSILQNSAQKQEQFPLILLLGPSAK